MTIEIEEINCRLTVEERSLIFSAAKYEADFYREIFRQDIPVMQIKIFGDSSEYRRFQNSISTSTAVKGFYSQSKKMALINKNDRFLRTAFHELNHLILRHFIDDVPKWLNEGLSEYFEYAAMEGKNVSIMLQPKKAERLKKWAAEQDKIQLADFVSWSNQEWKTANFKPDFYSSTLSWGLIYFFMSDEARREILKQIIAAIEKGENPLAAIDEFYPGKIGQLQNDFITFIQNEFR